MARHRKPKDLLSILSAETSDLLLRVQVESPERAVEFARVLARMPCRTPDQVDLRRALNNRARQIRRSTKARTA